MEGKVVKGNRITEGSIFGQLLLFFFPILFGTFFQQLYNTADAMVVGRFVGKQALAAVGGSTSTLINLLVGFFVGLSSGATVVISQFYGARKADKVHWAVHTSIAFSVIGGIIFMIVGLVGSPWALEAMKTPEDVMGHAVVYIRIYFLGIIVNLVYNMGAGILRAVGDSRRPLYFLIASCFTNIILDVLLVAVLGMGVAGAALATITSQLLSAVLVVLALMKTDDMYKLEWKKVRIDQRMLQRIVRIGIPAGMQSVMYNISNVIIQAGVNTLGTDNVTAWATYGKVDGLYWMMINALGISATTFVGQNFGAGRLDRVRKGAGACMVIGVVLTASVGVVLYNGGHLLVELFTCLLYTSPVYGTVRLQLLDIPYILQFIELVLYLFQDGLVSQGNHGHPGVPRVSGDTYSQTLNIVSAAAEQPCYTGQHTCSIVHKQR